MKKNPLVFCGIIGIVAGFVLGRVIEGADQNQFLTYGLIGGLVVGFLLDSRKKPSTTNPSGPANEPYKIPTADEIIEEAQAESSEGRSRVSRVQDETDVIARAREEIARNTGSSDNEIQAGSSEGKSRVSRVQDETDVIARAREEIARNTGGSDDDAESLLLGKKNE